MQEPTRRCHRCGTVRPISDFYIESEKRQHAKGRRNFRFPCRPCKRADILAIHAEKTRYLQQLKLERGCADCGLKVPYPEVYDFDHRPGVEKVGDVSRLKMSSSMAALVAEIAKCDVVCANCHRIRTFKRGDWHNGAGLDHGPRGVVIPDVEPPEDLQLPFDIA